MPMEDEIEKPQECYNFPAIRFWKKYKSHSPKWQHDHHKNHNISSHNSSKIKPSNEVQDQHSFKANHDKKHDAKYNYVNGVKKLGHNGNGVEELNEINQKHAYNHCNNGCFKTIILLSGAKKKQFPTKVSAADPPDNAIKQPVKKTPSRSSSLGTTPSLGRSRSINGSKSEAWAKTPIYSRAPTINRTTSTGSRPTSFNGRNGSFVNRSTSIGRSTSMQRKSITRSGPIIFSSSSGKMKPPALEQQLECTLEELYHGCVKHIKVPRDVYTCAGFANLEQVTPKEEMLTVNIKPGWKTGTKITFPGSPNDEKPGEYTADVIFIITEKHHPLFRRNEDDLELEIEIPLVDSLTGCTITIPLLGDKKSLEIDDIIYPGYEKILVGQGMPNQKMPHQRGDLKIKFLVEYPKRLTEDQKAEVFRILSG